MTKYKPTSLSISPTIVIGIGGSGVETMRLVKARIRNSLSPLPGIIEFLALDTEPRPNPPGAERIAQREYVYLGDYNATKVLENLDAHPHIKYWWFDDGELVTGSIYKGARQRRPVGRLSLYVNWGKFAHLFDVKAKRIREISRKEKEQARGVEVERHTGLVKIYIVGSLCGGTGSGVLLDVAFKVREVFGDDADISGVFLLPSCFLPEIQSLKQKQRVQANAYAALREINYFLQGHPFKTVFPDHPYSNGQGQVMESSLTRPFDALYLVDRNNGKEGFGELDSAFAMVAQYVFLDIVSPIGGKLDARRSNLRDLAGESSKAHQQASAQPLAVSTFVTASLTLPAERLSEKALTAFYNKFIRQQIIGNFSPTKQLAEDLDARFISLDEEFRLEKVSTLSLEDELFGTVSSAIKFDPSKSREVLQKALAQMQSDLNFYFNEYGLTGVHDIINAMESRVRERVGNLDTDIEKLEQKQAHLNQELDKEPRPSANPFQQSINSMMKLFGQETPLDKRIREWGEKQAILNEELGERNAELDQKKLSRKAFIKIQTVLGNLRSEIEDRLRLLDGILQSIQSKNITSDNISTRQSDGLFELSTEVKWEDCEEYLNYKIPGLLNLDHTPELTQIFKEIFFNCKLEPDPEGATLQLTSLPEQTTTRIRQKLEEAFKELVSTERLRILEYLKWFYDHKKHGGENPRFTPVDPLQMLQDRCQYPFLEIEPAHLGSERASDTEDVRLVGVEIPDKNDGIATEVIEEILEDFDNDTFTRVSTGVPERIDVLFSRHGYPVRVLKDLEEFKKNYDHFMNFEGEKLHLHRDWPNGMDLLDTQPQGKIVGIRFTAIIQDTYDNFIARKNRFICDLAAILKISPSQIHIQNIVAGSVRITLQVEIPEELAHEFMGFFFGEHKILQSLQIDKLTWQSIRTVNEYTKVLPNSKEPIGIPPELSNDLHDTLIRCGSFSNENTLRAIFVDERIRPWQDRILETNTPRERVACLISSLCDQFNNDHENALVVFLKVLAEFKYTTDGCYEQLSDVANRLEQHIRYFAYASNATRG